MCMDKEVEGINKSGAVALVHNTPKQRLSNKALIVSIAFYAEHIRSDAYIIAHQRGNPEVQAALTMQNDVVCIVQNRLTSSARKVGLRSHIKPS